MSQVWEQRPLIDMGEDWEDLWGPDMPEFIQDDLTPFDSIRVQFRDRADMEEFLKLMGERPDRRRSIWYPRMEQETQSDRDAPPVVVEANRYPVYVISKGRWETPYTSRALSRLGIIHRVVVEPQEFELYAAAVGPERLLVLPFSNLGLGSIPARNWVWEHSISEGAARHWILDDNIDGFYRLNRNTKRKVVDFNPFIHIEKFTDRHNNVAISGMNYEFFADRRTKQPPFRLNTRVYSCILIRCDIPYRWRGRYNEDTDLCLRALKDGWSTILFNSVLAKKLPTMTVKGGNTDELYAGEGRLMMAESLREQHPDVVKVTQRWGRPQHWVDYRPFQKNPLDRRTEQ